MKLTDIEEGRLYAVAGSSSYTRRLTGSLATKAKVVKVRDVLRKDVGSYHTHVQESTGVRVRWVTPGSRSDLPFRLTEVKLGKGEEMVIPSRLIWMPWSDYEKERAEALRDEKATEQSRAEQEARSAKVEGELEKLGFDAYVSYSRFKLGYVVELDLDEAEKLIERLSPEKEER